MVKMLTCPVTANFSSEYIFRSLERRSRVKDQYQKVSLIDLPTKNFVKVLCL